MTPASRLGLLFLFVFATGCGKEPLLNPAAPSAPPAAASAQDRIRVPVAGRVVDGDGNPVAGAKVTPWGGYRPYDTAVSDATGAFALTLTITPGRDRWFSVTVEKSGYETGELVRALETATDTVLRIRQIQRIDAGDSARATIRLDDTMCGYHWGFVCRRVRVASAAAGTLAIDIVADSSVRLGMLVGPDGFPQQVERRRTVSVTAGSETVVEVAAESLGAAAPFVLNTAMISTTH
jgi:hypothetical protein